VEPKPFLPHQQVDQTRPARSAGKTVILWFLLIVIFVAIYQIIGSAPAKADAPPQPTPVWPMVLGGMIAIAVATVSWLAWLQRSVRRYNEESADALTMLSRGDLGNALKRFEALASRWKRPRSVHAVVRHNVAYTLLRQGELARAIEIYSALERGRSTVSVGSVWPLTPCHLAIAHGLAGDLSSAQQWLDEAGKRMGTGDTRHLRGVAALALAIIDCRRGGGAGVARELERMWTEFENALTGELLRPLRAVRAYAVSQDGGLRGQGAVEMLMMPLRGGPPGELAFLGVAWPEMKAFLSAHSL
jgi:hypothetical protein